MKKAIVKAIAATGAVAVFGAAVLPLGSYAAGTANTDVEVAVNAECLIGNGTGNTSGESLLNVSLSATTQSAIDSGAAGDSIDVTCNQAWTLSEKALNDLATATNGLALKNTGTNEYDGAVGFTALGSAVTASATPVVGDLAGFAANTWGMAYTGANVTVTDWHGPATTDATIASGAATAKSSIVQYFGAKTDGSVPNGTYGATVTYTLAP